MDKTYSEKYRKLGQNIAYYRKDRGYTQMQLAELLDIDRSHMSAIEIANRGVSLDLIFKICDILNLSEKELFDFRQNPNCRTRCGGFFIQFVGLFMLGGVI